MLAGEDRSFARLLAGVNMQGLIEVRPCVCCDGREVASGWRRSYSSKRASAYLIVRLWTRAHIFVSLADRQTQTPRTPPHVQFQERFGLKGYVDGLILCTCLLALFEVIVAILKTDEDLLTLVSELREASWSGGASEEARRPFGVSGLPISRFLTLTLLKLLFLCGGLSILPAENGFCNTVPEFARLVGQLLLRGRDDLLYREQRVDVDEQNFVGVLRSRCRASGEIDLVMPGTLDATDNGLFWDVLDPGCVVVGNVTLVDNTFNLVLSLA
jgi:hypothetical protein